MSPARNLAIAALNHGNVVRHWALSAERTEANAEIAAAWEALLTSAHLFADEHGLDEPQMYAVMDAVVNATAITHTERNHQP